MLLIFGCVSARNIDREEVNKMSQLSRFENSPELFGRGSGIGCGFALDCQFCGITHNKSTDSENPNSEGDSVSFTNFAGLQVCDCCFGAIEEEVFRRMPDIIPWYIRRLKAGRIQLEEQERMAQKLATAPGLEVPKVK